MIVMVKKFYFKVHCIQCKKLFRKTGPETKKCLSCKEKNKNKRAIEMRGRKRKTIIEQMLGDL